MPRGVEYLNLDWSRCTQTTGMLSISSSDCQHFQPYVPEHGFTVRYRQGMRRELVQQTSGTPVPQAVLYVPFG